MNDDNEEYFWSNLIAVVGAVTVLGIIGFVIFVGAR